MSRKFGKKKVCPRIRENNLWNYVCCSLWFYYIIHGSLWVLIINHQGHFCWGTPKSPPFATEAHPLSQACSSLESTGAFGVGSFWGGGFVEDGVVISYFCEFLGWVFCVCVFFCFWGFVASAPQKKRRREEFMEFETQKKWWCFFLWPKKDGRKRKLWQTMSCLDGPQRVG